MGIRKIPEVRGYLNETRSREAGSVFPLVGSREQQVDVYLFHAFHVWYYHGEILTARARCSALDDRCRSSTLACEKDRHFAV